MAKSQYYFDQRYLNTDDPWGIFCRPSQIYRLGGYIKKIDELCPKKVQRLLEIACADGYFTAMIANKAEEIIAIDYNPTLIKVAKKRGLSDTISFHVSNLPDIPEVHEHFDIITAFEVILYFTHDQKRLILERVHTLLKKDGVFIFTEDYKTISALIDSRKFNVMLVEKPLTNLLGLQDYTYNIARRISFVVHFVWKYKKDPSYIAFAKKYKQKVIIKTLITLEPILRVLTPLLHLFWLFMHLFYSSKLIHHFLLFLSRMLKYKSDRHTIIIKKL